LPGRIGLVAEIGLVSIGRNLVLHRGKTGGAQGAEAYLLRELVERVAHTRSSTRAQPELPGSVSIPDFPGSTHGLGIAYGNRHEPRDRDVYGRCRAIRWVGEGR
jgi:hypothetical protein